MISTKFYHDKRFTKGDENISAPIKLVISRNRTTALLSTGIKVLPSEWNNTTQSVVNHNNHKKLNIFLAKFKLNIESIIIELEETGNIAMMTAADIKNYLITELSPKDDVNEEQTFYKRYIHFSETKKAQRTKELYQTTLKRISEFDKDIQKKSFDDINKRWLSDFDRFLSKTSPSQNARNIHFRNIRAVFNDAIDDEITSNYPFRKFKLHNEPTIKRSLTTFQIRELFKLDCWEYYQEYLDIFKLIFYLCGINLIDLFNLKHSNIVNGRVEYIRAKTHKKYSVKLEPEALVIIEKYKGEKWLLNIHERYKNHKNYMSNINKGLSKIGHITGKNKNGVPIMVPICNQLTTYWARHTWATIAAELDIPKETIAAGLGHNIGSPITSIYIDFNLKKVDEANRKIINYINN